MSIRCLFRKHKWAYAVPQANTRPRRLCVHCSRVEESDRLFGDVAEMVWSRPQQ